MICALLTHTSCNKDYIDSTKGIVLFGNVTDDVTGDPISGVIISDGYFSTITNEKGEYKFNVHIDARHVFYSVPENYEIPIRNGTPEIFKEIETNNDSLQRNFELTQLKNGVENEFTLFCVADPQVWDTRTLNRFNSETMEDLKKEATKHKVVYGVSLGDLVGDTPELFGEIKRSFSSTEVPFFHTIGNHDFIKNAENSIQAIEEYENNFGPVNFSFNRGNSHIVVMNNVLFKANQSYEGGFTNEQIKWLGSNLQYVPKEKLLIVCVHIPVTDTREIVNRAKFLELIMHFNETHIISGHYHLNHNVWLENYGIYEHITGAASGLVWSGTVNKDGAPNGYGVYEISGNKIKDWHYKSTNHDRNFQMRIYAPNTFGDKEGYVVANVWNADEKWKIELFENGIHRGEMKQYRDYDPGTYAFIKSTGRIEPGNENSHGWYNRTSHLYRLKANNPLSSFTVKATDRLGNVYYQNQMVTDIKQFKGYK